MSDLYKLAPGVVVEKQELDRVLEEHFREHGIEGRCSWCKRHTIVLELPETLGMPPAHICRRDYRRTVLQHFRFEPELDNT